MAAKNFFRENFVLLVGITLPILLMAGFMVAASLPQTLTDPPKYDVIFATTEYPNGADHRPVSAQLVVKKGVLKAQYTKNAPNTTGNWKKLYRYDAKSQKVIELAFGLPDDATEITGMKEETVEATKGLKLDTTVQSPDGYTLTNESYYGHNGLLGDVFWGGGSYSNEERLRKGAASVKLTDGKGAPYYYNNLEFIGWVAGKN